jgi:long-chain fatty acid transport protein
MLALLLSLPATASAGGIFVPGSGAQAQARAGAFVARADDPSALLYNPAGFAKLDGTQLTLSTNLVDYDIAFQRAGFYKMSNAGDVPPSYEGAPYPEVKDISKPALGIGRFQAIPFLGISTDLGRKQWPVRFAFGFFSAQGYPERHFPESMSVQGPDPAPAPQRYDVIIQKASPIQPSLAIAYRVLPKLDLGLRVTWGIVTAEGRRATWSVTNYEEFPGRDSVFTIKDAIDPFVPSYGLGALYRPTEYLEFGAAYNSEVSARAVGIGNAITGDLGLGGLQVVPLPDDQARCEGGGRVDHLKACLYLTLPRNATLGGRYIFRDRNGGERGDIELDLAWENWSSADQIRIVVDGADSLTNQPLNETLSRNGFRDTYSVRLGGSYSQPLGNNKLIFRTGAAYDTAAAPDTFIRLEQDGKARTTLTGGLAFETSRFRIDAGGGVVLEPIINVPQCQPPNGPSVAQPGCDGTGRETPVSERVSPDPIQPLRDPGSQVQSPYNAGRYKSSYVLLSLGVTTWF